jgi:hypothetical protein
VSSRRLPRGGRGRCASARRCDLRDGPRARSRSCSSRARSLAIPMLDFSKTPIGPATDGDVVGPIVAELDQVCRDGRHLPRLLQPCDCEHLGGHGRRARKDDQQVRKVSLLLLGEGVGPTHRRRALGRISGRGNSWIPRCWQGRAVLDTDLSIPRSSADFPWQDRRSARRLPLPTNRDSAGRRRRRVSALSHRGGTPASDLRE